MLEAYTREQSKNMFIKGAYANAFAVHRILQTDIIQCQRQVKMKQ